MATRSDFIRYAGPAAIHDSTFLLFRKNGADSYDVHLNTSEEKVLILRFIGVTDLLHSKPEGMLIYALSEMTCDQGLRRYIFANSDEESDSIFEITCKEMKIQTEQDAAANP